VLIPSAQKRAKKYGGRPEDYTAFFREHATCLFARRNAPLRLRRVPIEDMPVTAQGTTETSTNMNDTDTTAAPIAAKFIAYDYCGWNMKYGRFTAMPSGDTLTCQPYMGHLDWDKAQLAWFLRFDSDIVVHRNRGDGPYRETGDIIGKVSEIVARLRDSLLQRE
jgi:hypothetical protein